MSMKKRGYDHTNSEENDQAAQTVAASKPYSSKSTSTKKHNLSASSFSSSTDTEEYAPNMNNIDYLIYKNCERSKLKVVYMHKNDLRKWRNNQDFESSQNTSSRNQNTFDKEINQNDVFKRQSSNYSNPSKKL